MLDEDGWVGRWAKLFFHFDKPLIAAVNGIAAGAGMSTALAADLRVGSELTRFKTVFIERSLSPDSGMSYFLPRIVGYARAADLIFTSRAVDAEEAYRLGLLDRLVKSEALIEESFKLAAEMTQWPPLALRLSKRTLQHNFEADLDTALRYESVSLGFARKAANDAERVVAGVPGEAQTDLYGVVRKPARPLFLKRLSRTDATAWFTASTMGRCLRSARVSMDCGSDRP